MQITRSPRERRLKKESTASDLVLLTISDYSNLVSTLNGKLNLAGGKLTGYVSAHADPTQALHLSTKRYTDETSSSLVNAHAALTQNVHGATANAVANRIMIRDGNGRVSVADPTADSHVANRGWVLGTTGGALQDHADSFVAHGATAQATGGRIVLRDGSGRFHAGAPTAGTHVARLNEVAAALAELHAHMESNDPHGNVVSELATPSTLAERDAAGRLAAANPSAGTHVVNLTTLNSRLGNHPFINPTSGIKNGDIQTSGSTIFIRAGGGWRQIYPAIYA